MASQTEEMLKETQANLLAGADQRAADAVRQLVGEYHAGGLLGECIAFSRYNFVDGWPGDLNALSRVGWFPWVVAEHELNVALYQVLLGMHSSVYDNLRRATEITLIGALFVSGRAALEESSGWVMSERPTPFFSRALDRLLKGGRFRALDAETKWAERIRSWYWRLADVIHVRGKDHWIEHSVMWKNGMAVPSYDSGAVEKAADAYITTVRHLCTILATANPILLHGLPLDEKFGLEASMSGYFNTIHAERLWRLLPEDDRPFARRLFESDPEVAAVIRHFDGLRDLTAEDIRTQAKRIEELIESHRTARGAD
jgi:hypothetical protein